MAKAVGEGYQQPKRTWFRWGGVVSGRLACLSFSLALCPEDFCTGGLWAALSEIFPSHDV